MKVARLTAASAHHLRDAAADSFPADTALAGPVLSDTVIILSPVLMYGVPVSCPYTSYRYVVKHYLYDV
jgi:hypothetical protein